MKVELGLAEFNFKDDIPDSNRRVYSREVLEKALAEMPDRVKKRFQDDVTMIIAHGDIDDFRTAVSATEVSD